jgi:hypothetical protein
LFEFCISIADTRLFAGRRWCNPADPNDRAKLDAAYDDLIRSFPPFDAACSRERFLQTLSDMSALPCLQRRDEGREPRRTLAEPMPPSQLLALPGGDGHEAIGEEGEPPPAPPPAPPSPRQKCRRFTQVCVLARARVRAR